MKAKRGSPPPDVAERVLDAWLAFVDCNPDYSLHGHDLLCWEKLDNALADMDESMKVIEPPPPPIQAEAKEEDE